MKYVAAYMLAQLGGKKEPSADDLKAILLSVGSEFDQERADKLISELKGKDTDEVISSGLEKLTSVPSGGAAPAAGGAAPAGGAAAAEAAPAAEEKKEEPKEESDEVSFSFLCSSLQSLLSSFSFAFLWLLSPFFLTSFPLFFSTLFLSFCSFSLFCMFHKLKLILIRSLSTLGYGIRTFRLKAILHGVKELAKKKRKRKKWEFKMALSLSLCFDSLWT